MSWIESHQSLERHPKLLKFSALMGWSKNESIGILHRLWWWAIDYAEDGVLSKYQPAEIALALDVIDGDKFVSTLVECSFLDRKKDILCIHDWWDFAGKFLTIRYKHKPEKYKKIMNFYIKIKNTPKGCSKNTPNNTKQTIQTVPTIPNQDNHSNLTNKDGTDEMIKYADFVSLTSSEYQKLVEEHGEALAKRMVETLSNYKGAHGKRYKSDYRAILSWVVDKVKGASNGTANAHQGHSQTARTPAGGIKGDAALYDANTIRFDDSADGG